MEVARTLARTSERIPPIRQMRASAFAHSARRYLRNPLVIYAALALAGTALIIAAVAPLASTVVQRWSQRDVELRSRLVFTSIRDQVAAGLASASSSALVPFFERIAEDERLLALGFCSEAGRLENATKRMPSSIRCSSVARTKTDTFATVFDSGHRLLVSAFPLTAGAGSRPPDHSARPALRRRTSFEGSLLRGGCPCRCDHRHWPPGNRHRSGGTARLVATGTFGDHGCSARH